MILETSDCIGGSAEIDPDGIIKFKPESMYFDNKQQVDRDRTQRNAEALSHLASSRYHYPITVNYSSFNFTPSILALFVSTTNSNITAFAEEPTEKSESEFDKIKKRSKLSAKGKSPYGPQRR